MASMRDIQRRRNSIASTQQITKAMKLVSTVKLQRTREKAEECKPYFNHMYATVTSMLARTGIVEHPYLKSGKSGKKGVIVISSNRGLAGGYNSNIVKMLTQGELEGKELLIKYLEQSDPDENGIRTLSFQVNGSIRTVKIQDHNLEIKTDRRLKADKNNPQHLGSSIPGTVDKVLVKEGDVVTKNMPLMTIEAMKMETTVVSTVNGTVDKIYVEAGDSVHQDDLLVSDAHCLPHIKE